MKDWIEIIQGTKEACDNFLNRNIFSQDRKLYKWENNILYKKIAGKEIKSEENKNGIELYKLF